jgi:hypothetical protein
MVQDALRKQLVSELDQALAKIEFIQRRIEIRTLLVLPFNYSAYFPKSRPQHEPLAET